MSGRSCIFASLMLFAALPLLACTGDSATDPDQPVATTVEITPDPLLLDKHGDSAQLIGRVLDQNGNVMPSVAVTWSTSDERVATVNGGGIVTSGEVGEVTITARAAGAQGSASVEVMFQPNGACAVPSVFPAQPAIGAMPSVWQSVPDPVAGGRIRFDDGHRIAAGDFDADGDQDAIVLDMSYPPENAGRTVLWRNRGGTFEDATAAMLDPDSVGENSTRDLEIGDFNGDGVVDLFRAQHGYDADPFPGAPNVLLLSQPDGTLRDVSSTGLRPNEGDGFTHTSAALDVDCDGDPDLFTSDLGSETGRSKAHLYMNDGTGTFQADDTRLPEEIASGSLVGLSAGACDLDRDGDPDLVVGRWGSSNPELEHDLVLMNNGFGHYRRAAVALPRSHFGSSNIPSDLACTDLNLDGWPDVVVGNSSSNQSGGEDYLSVWLNRSELVFEEVSLFEQRPDPDRSGANSLYGVFDVNGDGWPDIVRRSFPREEALLINRGGEDFAAFDLPHEGAHFIDADGDGRLDVLWPGVNNEGCACPPELYLQR